MSDGAKGASVEMMEQWGMVSIKASELTSLRTALAEAVGALRWVTDEYIEWTSGKPLVVVTHSVNEHYQHYKHQSDGCKICAALSAPEVEK